MKLDGSCHCGAVTFQLDSKHPYPFNKCYCSICRKTQGGGGYAINLSGDYNSMDITGRENLTVYRVRLDDGTESPAERNFCAKCGSGLWVWDPRWPELVHPFASSMDTPLPTPPEHTHLMLGSKAPWVGVHEGADDKRFAEYPDESIADWHQRLGLRE
jgi:hypothetical protein